MRLFYLFSIAVLLITSCNSSNNNEKKEAETPSDSTALAAEQVPIDTANLPKFDFENSEFDFGTINEGDVVKHTFKFTNIGKSNLQITDARGSCGCTIPSYPKEAIAPGEGGVIEVQFNSKNKAGANQKFVTIDANTYPKETRISIKANVKGKDDSAGPLAH